MEAHSRYWPILILALGIWLAGEAWASAQESIEIPGYTLENRQTYGNCEAATRVDQLTDEEAPVLRCRQIFAHSLRTSIGILADQEGPLEVRLDTGEQSHPHDDITVAIRIDKRPLLSITAKWRKTLFYHIAMITDRDFARFLLEELATGRRVVLRVGMAQRHINLHGAAAAIADFRSRIRP